MTTPANSRSEVTVVDVQMPFGSMVVFMIKWALATIPAIIILAIIWLVGAAFLAGLFGGLTRH